MTDPIPVNAPSGGDERRRLMLLIGIGGGLVVVVLLAGLLMGGGGGDDDDDTALPTTPPVTGPGSGGDADDDLDEEPPEETFEVFSTKNPFEPLIFTGPDVTIPPDGSGTTVPPGGNGRTGTTVPGGSGGTPTTAPGGDGGAEPERRERVALLDLFDGDDGERTASVRVNDTVYTVTTGEQFADRYQAVSLGEECGDFLFGDSRFELCVGEETVK